MAQLNPQMPYTFGDSELPIDWIDLAVEVDEPLASPEPRPPDATERQIGERIARFADDGTTLQLGIGQIPTVAAERMCHLRQLACGPRCSAMASFSSTDQGPLTPTD